MILEITKNAEISMESYKVSPWAEHMRELLNTLGQMSREFIISCNESGELEVIAQATLAMRHIEDAHMRYWKAIQYDADGESIYKK